MRHGRHAWLAAWPHGRGCNFNSMNITQMDKLDNATSITPREGSSVECLAYTLVFLGIMLLVSCILITLSTTMHRYNPPSPPLKYIQYKRHYTTCDLRLCLLADSSYQGPFLWKPLLMFFIKVDRCSWFCVRVGPLDQKNIWKVEGPPEGPDDPS